MGTVAVCLLFGVVVYHKQIRLRQGDQVVYYRAGWSMRHGGTDLYDITDHHGFHYLYPPVFAILMIPLADPPLNTPTEEQKWILPKWARMVVHYVFNLMCLFWASNLWIGCLEMPQPFLSTRRVRLFLWPLLVCLSPIVLTFVRGQLELLLLLLIAGFANGLVRGRRLSAGLCLAAAICAKVIPAFLLLVPLWQRDRRCLVGCAAGLVVGLGLIPILVVGPIRTAELYAAQWKVLLAPALGLGDDNSRAGELLDAGATVNQSFQMVMHMTLHYGQPNMPPRPATWVRAVHWLLTGLLTALVFWRHGRVAALDGRNLLRMIGLLLVIMVLASPVCHLHYFTLVLPLALCVIERLTVRRVSRLCWLALLLPALAYTVWEVFPLKALRDLNLPLYTTLILWTVAWLEFRSADVVVGSTSTARLAA
jgi:hypothetical protein